MMIIKSHTKQKNKSILILIQLFIASFSICIGLGLLEFNISHITQVKSVFSLNTLCMNINIATKGETLSKEQKTMLENLYKHIKNDNRVSSIGSYDIGYIKSDTSDRPDELYRNVKVIAIDNDLMDLFNNSKNIGTIKDYKNKSIPVLVGKNVKNIIPIGSSKIIKLNSGNKEYPVTVDGVIKKHTFSLTSGFGNTISKYIEEPDDNIIVVLPKDEPSLFKNQLLINLKNNFDDDSFKKDLNETLNKYNMTGSIHNINDELNIYINRNKIPIMACIGISLILLILSSFGLLGVILSSIIRRKIEFGIRYSIGATPKNIMQLIVGEILFLFLVGNFLGIMLALIISLFSSGIKIGMITIFTSTVIMLIFCFLASLMPAIKIVRIEPVKLINKGSD
jgi:putative ABC transport system permease protein